MAQVVEGQEMKAWCESKGCLDDQNEDEKKESKLGGAEDEVEYAYAPESFWLSKEAELDWLDRNAYLDRRDSGKGTSSGGVTSQRYSNCNTKNKTKASLLALPKPQKQNYGLIKNRRNGRLFPKRSEPKPNAVLSMNEPGSPKVSCMGRVRSRKDSRRTKKAQNHPPTLVSGVGGFWNNFRSMFRSKGHAKPPQNENEVVPKLNQSITNNRADDYSNSEPPPTLGVMNRFASGRKSDDLVHSCPIWRRRQVDQPLLHVQRDWRTVGPLSV